MKRLALLALALALPAQAAPNPLLLEVPRSRIELDEGVAREPSESTVWEILASSWSPARLQPASVVTRMPSYRSGSLPYLSLSRLSSLLSGSKGELDLKLGAGMHRMAREAAVVIGNQERIFEQSIYLLPVRVGVEYRAVVSYAGIRPYAGAALLPTLALTPRSSLEKGRSSVGLPIEGSLGLVRGFRVASFSPQLDVGMIVTAGAIEGSSVAGFGLHAGLRMDLGI
ncbi:MAG: hypothetical protein NDJ90_01100 [Oligoflexia bacterium]|nr:hypothetical protein [Oligoflexia bacterium]